MAQSAIEMRRPRQDFLEISSLADEDELFGQSFDGFWDWHIKEDFKYLSPRSWEILGFSSPQDRIHKPKELHELMFQEDYPALMEMFEKHVATHGAFPFQAECRYRHKDGSTVVHFYCKGRVIEWDETDGSPVRMVGTHTDITELRQRQKNAREELERNLQIDFSRLKLLDRIGEGAFGSVFKCQYHGMTMAEKCINSSTIQQNFIQNRQHSHRPLGPPVSEEFGDVDMHDGKEMSEMFDDDLGGDDDDEMLQVVDAGVNEEKDSSETSTASNNNEAIVDFRKEIEVLKTLRHPNIVLLLAYSTTPRYEVALFELMQCSLLHVLDHHRRKRTTLEAEKQIQYAMDFARGMQYLHTCQPMVIHRDLKPSNLLIDHSGVLKVCDFGLSCLLEAEDRSRADHVMTGETGTYRFMAPEVFRRESYNEKVDIYSFALILYNILTGQRPWPSLDGVTAAHLAAEGDRPPIDQTWDSRLQYLLDTCWRGNAALRPSFGTILTVLAEYQEEVHPGKNIVEVNASRIRLTSQTSFHNNSCCVIL